MNRITRPTARSSHWWSWIQDLRRIHRSLSRASWRREERRSMDLSNLLRRIAVGGKVELPEEKSALEKVAMKWDCAPRKDVDCPACWMKRLLERMGRKEL
jgi:hypothetical protein